MNTIAFKGIDGSSPLGILAALGAMRVISFHDPKATMAWDCSATTHFPVIETKLTTDACLREIRLEALRIAGFPLDYSQRKQEITLEQKTLKDKLDKAQDAFDKAQATCRRKTADTETRLKREQKLQECADKLKALQEQWHDFQTNPLHDVKIWEDEQNIVNACHKVSSILKGNIIKYSPNEFHDMAITVIDSPNLYNNHQEDYFAAFASDGNLKDGFVARTALSMTNGGHGLCLLKDFKRLLPLFNIPIIESSLLLGNPILSDTSKLNWSPADYNNNALRSTSQEEKTNKTDTVMYAVAFLGLPAFPCMPGNRELLTTGIVLSITSEPNFSWPIWETPISIQIILSLLKTSPQKKICSKWFCSKMILENHNYFFLPGTPFEPKKFPFIGKMK